jgi:hypothetical protein
VEAQFAQCKAARRGCVCFAAPDREQFHRSTERNSDEFRGYTKTGTIKPGQLSSFSEVSELLD